MGTKSVSAAWQCLAPYQPSNSTDTGIPQVHCPTISAIFIRFDTIRLRPVWEDEGSISGRAMEDMHHRVATDSLTRRTCRMVSSSQWVLSQKTGLLHPLGSYQKDGNGALTSVGNMWSVLKWLCGCHHPSACIPGEIQSFLNDL
jgi:hypothetical protein